MFFLPTSDMFSVLPFKNSLKPSTQTPFSCFEFLKILLVTLVMRKVIYIELKRINYPTFYDVQFTGRKVIIKGCAERFHMCDNFPQHIFLQASTFENYFIKERKVCQVASLKSGTTKRQFADKRFQFLGRFYNINFFSL